MRSTVMVLALAGLVGGASAQVVFENPWDPNASDAGAFSQGSQLLAGEFDLSSGATVALASWYGTMFSSDPLDTGDTWNFDVIFWSNNGGQPGSEISWQSVVADVTDTGWDITGERAYLFDASFTGVTLSGSTTYFFSVENTGTQNTFRWNMGTDAAYSGWFTHNSGGSWNDLGSREPLNFRLAVPAPASMAILGLGGLTAIRRRR